MSAPDQEHDYPFDAIDLACMFVAAAVPWLVPIALLQYFLRRSETVRRDMADLAAWARGQNILPGPQEPPEQPAPVVPDTQAAPPLIAPQNAAQGVTPWREWMGQAVRAHHLFVVGNTGSGKTTLVRALLVGKRGGLLILDPKNRPGKWGGVDAIGLDDDAEYVLIERAMQYTLALLRQRQKALNGGQTQFTPLTVVVDEAPDVAAECPTFPPVFTRVGSLGRELNINLIVLSQRSTVKALGIDGDGQARENFTRILMGKFARRAVPALEGQQHCAVYDDEGDIQTLQVDVLPRIAQAPIKCKVVRVPNHPPRTANRFSEPPQHAGGSGHIRTGSEPVQATGSGQSYGQSGQFNEPPEPVLTAAAIRAAMDKFGSKNRVCTWLAEAHGVRHKPKALGMIDAAMSETDEPPRQFDFLG